MEKSINNMFFVIFENNEKEKIFYEKVNKIAKNMNELVSDWCLLPENALSELVFACSNRNIANISEIELMEEIKYEINDIINEFNFNDEQIKTFSEYILRYMYRQ